MRLNKKGWELYDIWENKYYEENDRLGGNSAEKIFVEGWSIIENDKFVKTSEDVVGLYLFGFDLDIFHTIDEWKENGMKGDDNVWDGVDLTLDDFEKEIEKYFVY